MRKIDSLGMDVMWFVLTLLLPVQAGGTSTTTHQCHGTERVYGRWNVWPPFSTFLSEKKRKKRKSGGEKEGNKREGNQLVAPPARVDI